MTNIPNLFCEPSKIPPLHCCVLLSLNLHLRVPKAFKRSIRPVTDSAKRSFGQWITSEGWEEVYTTEGAEQKAAKFEQKMLEKYELYFPQKSVRRRHDDKPWLTERLRRMINKRSKAYQRGNTELYNKLRNQIQHEICLTKEKFYETKVAGLKTTAPGKWHRHVKTMTGSKSTSTLNMDHLSKDPEELAGIINNHFASVCNQMPCLNLSCLPAFRPTLPPPLISPGEVRRSLNKINTSKATYQSDIPSKIIKEFFFLN